MKRKSIFLVILVLFLVLVTASALAEDDDVAKFNNWLAQAKEKASAADHVLGPDDVDTIRKVFRLGKR